MASSRASRLGSRPVSGQRWRNASLGETLSCGTTTSAVVVAFGSVAFIISVRPIRPVKVVPVRSRVADQGGHVVVAEPCADAKRHWRSLGAC